MLPNSPIEQISRTLSDLEKRIERLERHDQVFTINAGETVINEAGIDRNFRIEGLTELNALFVDAGNDRTTMEGQMGGTLNTTTIVGGAIAYTSLFMNVNAQGGVPDNLDTITGLFNGALVIIRSSGLAAITVRDGVGNLRLAGNFVMDSFQDTLMLIGAGASWQELSRSDNG